MPLHDTRPMPTFPADYAFVLQLQRGTALTPEALQGQVEHIVTGQEADFNSVADLLAFIATVLRDGSEPA
jgi:hypothetical protein